MEAWAQPGCAAQGCGEGAGPGLPTVAQGLRAGVSRSSSRHPWREMPRAQLASSLEHWGLQGQGRIGGKASLGELSLSLEDIARGRCGGSV